MSANHSKTTSGGEKGDRGKPTDVNKERGGGRTERKGDKRRGKE
jgi:hypothetical protein